MLKHTKSVKSVDAGEDFFFVQEVRSANGWQIMRTIFQSPQNENSS